MLRPWRSEIQRQEEEKERLVSKEYLLKYIHYARFALTVMISFHILYIEIFSQIKY